jgi:hypothetical protein
MTAGDATGRKAIVSRRSMSAPIISIREGTCRSAQKRIDAFLEDRLPPHATRWFVRHLLRCLNGRQDLKSRDRAKGQMKAETHENSRAALVTSITARIPAGGARVTPELAETKNPDGPKT